MGCLPRGVSIPERCLPGECLIPPDPESDTPPRCPLKRAVWILLECILVNFFVYNLLDYTHIDATFGQCDKNGTFHDGLHIKACQQYPPPNHQTVQGTSVWRLISVSSRILSHSIVNLYLIHDRSVLLPGNEVTGR